MGFWDWIFGRAKETETPPLLLAVQPPRLPAAAPPPVKAAAPEVPAVSPKPAPPRYSIDAAIALMRALPMDEDPELVLRVVRKTLRSTGVSVEELIETARRREGTQSESIAEDRRTIEQLERDIADRRAHIETVAKQLAETTSVRERLQEAVQAESKVGTLLSPEEIARLQAERVANGGGARADSRFPPRSGAIVGVVPASVAPGPSKRPSLPPPPKTSVAPPLARPMIPQPPRVPTLPPKVSESSRNATSNEDASSNDEVAVVTPIVSDIDSLFTTDDRHPSEPTIRKAIDVSAGAASHTSHTSEEAEKTS